MKQVIVRNLVGIQTHGAEMEDPSAWIADCEQHQFWGVPGSYSVEVLDISHEHAMEECIAARKAAYPSPEEFMNAYFDGGEQAIEVLRHIRLTIKAAHPKPIKEG